MSMTAETVLITEPAGELKPGWRVVRFGDVVSNVDVAERKPLERGLERFVGLEHLDPESLHIKRWGLIEEGTSFTRKFVRGQVLFGKRRAYQRKAAVAEFDGICSGDILVFEPKGDELLPELLPFIVQSDGFFEHALGTSAGSLSPRTKWSDLARYEFALPPKDEQRRIADILWAADEMVSAWQTVLFATSITLATVRREVVCDNIHPRHALKKCLKGITPGKSVVGVGQPAKPNEFGVLKVSAVGASGFMPEENKRLVEPRDFRQEFRVKMNDILITRCNTRELVGRACIVPDDADNLMLSDKTLRLDVDEKVASKTFLLEVLRSNEARSQIEAVATGTGGAMKNISQDEVRSFLVPLPDLETQERIASVIASITETKRLAEAHVANSKGYGKSLIKELLTPPN